jgi:riboflavin synthase
MFTGIVEEMGSVLRLVQVDDLVLWNGERGSGWVLTISAQKVLQGAYEGCSIAVNGTCLTVTKYDGSTFEVGCAPET